MMFQKPFYASSENVMRNPMDRQSTLEKLDNSVWADSNFDSNLVRRCHELRKVALNRLTIEDLRLLIGQKIGLNFLIDIAIEKLQEDILVEGDLYPGDLLQSVIGQDKKYWQANMDKYILLDKLIKTNQDKLKDVKINLSIFNL